MSEQVFFSPVTAIKENNSIGTLICGQPGGGKSFCMVNMAANCLEQGCNVFILDAKNDMLPLQNLFPDIKVTDVNNIAAGSLDPFQVFDDVDSSTIQTVVQLMYGGTLPEEHAVEIDPIITDFINAARRDKSASFTSFVDYLYQHKSKGARAIGNKLRGTADTKYGKLLFGKVGQRVQSVKVHKNESRVISILGMSLPDGYTDTRPDERLNSAVVYIICKMILDVLNSGKRDENRKPTVFMLDECHVLLRSPAIEKVVDDLLVLGRSLAVAVVMASQNVTHFPSNMSQLISTKIAFKMSKKESAEFFDWFDTSSFDNEIDVASSIDLVTRLRTGYCYIIDKIGRASLVHITSNYPLEIITSNPMELNKKYQKGGGPQRSKSSSSLIPIL